MTIMQLLANNDYIIVNREIAIKLGLDEAVILGELCSEYVYYANNNQLTEDGYFYSTVDNIEKKTTLKEKRQRTALNNLSKLGIVKVDRRELPAKRFIKIEEENLMHLLFNDNEKSSSAILKELEPANPPINNNIYNNINNNSSYDELENETKTEFEFGKPQKKEQKGKSLFDKCADKIFSYSENKQIQNALFSYLQFILKDSSEKGKSFYVNNFVGMLNNLSSVAKTDSEKLESINKSLIKGYWGFYPVSNTTSYSDNTATHNIPTRKCNMSEEEWLSTKQRNSSGDLEVY